MPRSLNRALHSRPVSTGPSAAGRATPSVADPGAIAALGEALRADGLNGEGLHDVLGVSGGLLARSGDIAVHERRLAGVEPLGPIVRLFVLELPVPIDEAKRALASVGLERMEAFGLVRSDGTEVTALVRIVPHDEILIASDRRLPSGNDAPDFVAGVQGPSLTLSHLTVRRPVETALDVGTGNGIQAILASRHSGRVLATDLNERALEFTAFNAAAERRREHRDPRRQLLRAGRRAPFRPRHLQPAVRDVARVGVPLPRQRPRGRQRLTRRRRRLVRPPRGGRVRHDPRQLGARSRRRLVGAAA